MFQISTCFASISIWPEICFNATNRILVACIESKLNHSLEIKTTRADLDCDEFVKCFFESLLILKTIDPPMSIDLSILDGDHSWVEVFPSDFHQAAVMSLLTVDVAGRAHDVQQQSHSSDLERCSVFITLSLNHKGHMKSTGDFTVSMIVVAALCAVRVHLGM
jgi:hypothetical protein